MALSPGTATAGTIGRQSIAATATEASGAISPYAHQWQYQWPRGSATWITATGPGTTTRSAIITGLGPSAKYNFRLRYVDSTSAVVFFNTLSVQTKPPAWYPGLVRRRHGADF